MNNPATAVSRPYPELTWIALITGWGLGDTHGGVSNFRYGLDNWIWAMQGYNNSSPRVDGKPSQTFRMGFWRFKLSQDDPRCGGNDGRRRGKRHSTT